MNFDDIKDAWDKDQPNDSLSLPVLRQLKAARQPIDKIRCNIKTEMYAQAGCILLLVFFPFFRNISPELYLPFYTLYLVMVIVTVYYLIRFRAFSRIIRSYTDNSRESLQELYFEIRLNMELYKSYSFSMTPIAALMVIVLNYDRFTVPRPNLLLLGIFVVCFLVLVLFFTHWWVNYCYGRYARQIKTILEELKEM